MQTTTLMKMSPFRWINMFGDQSLRMSMGFEGFVGVANTSNLSVAFGKKSKGKRYSHRPQRLNSNDLVRIDNKWYMKRKDDDSNKTDT